MQLTLQDDLVAAAHLTEQDARLTLAVSLYAEQRLTLAQAARLADLDRLSFQHALAVRQVDLNYGAEGLAMDLAELERRGV